MSETPTTIDDDRTDRQTIDDALGAAAYTAVGVLTEMQKRDAYYARDVGEAIAELEAGLETPGVAETPAGERAAAAVERLEALETAVDDERTSLIRAALADLAPVAANVADHTEFDADDEAAGRRPPSERERPRVPVFYHVPKAAADRAIERFNACREHNPYPESPTFLEGYIWDEIEEQAVIWVDGDPLGEYAGGRVESMVIEPEGDAAGDGAEARGR